MCRPSLIFHIIRVVSRNKALIAVATIVAFLVITSVISITEGGFLTIPAMTPESWKKGQNVPLWVNKVTSVHNPIPYRYHDLPVCVPDNILHKSDLGEIITGNRIESSLYKLQMLVPVQCSELCTVVITPDKIDLLKELIHQEYLAQWQVDSLPAALNVYETGFPLGYTVDNGEIILNNHMHIVIHYNSAKQNTIYEDQEYNIIFFEVQPWSIAYIDKNVVDICKNALKDNQAFSVILEEGQMEVQYTYSVQWKKTATAWVDRWNNYIFIRGEGQVHWFSMINSIVIVFFLSGLVVTIMARTIHCDFLRYMEDPEETEESGWKLVRSDVFRPPVYKSFFSVLVGSGVQVFGMCLVTLVFAIFGFLSPSNSGSLTNAVIVLYVWMGVAAGYSSSRLYFMFGVRPKRQQPEQ